MGSAFQEPYIAPEPYPEMEPYPEGEPISGNASEHCLADEGSKWIYVTLMPLPLLAGIVNVVVWLAASIYRKKLLRQNYVYTCVTSTLLSNVAFLAFHLWDEIESYRIPAIVSRRPPGQQMQILWTLCHSAAVSLLFVMCGNLAVLVYVMLDSTYFQKRHRKRVQSVSREDNARNTLRTLNLRRRKAIILIVISWILPLILTIVAVVRWNCAALCTCSLGAHGELCPASEGCSRVWAPLSNSFIGVNIGLWLIEVIGLITLNIHGIRNFQSFTGVSTRTRKCRSQIVSSVTLSREGLSNDGKQAPAYETNSTVVFDETKNKRLSSSSVPEKGEDCVFRSGVQTTRMSLANPRLRLIVFLSSTFVICTLPVAIAFFIDVGVAEFNVFALRIPFKVFVHLYTLLCPLLLVTYMSNLRKAVNRFFDALFCSLFSR